MTDHPPLGPGHEPGRARLAAAADQPVAAPPGAAPRPMYSNAWFDTFASTVPERTTQGDVDAVARLAPLRKFPRLLDVGCGTGRVAAPLSALGYQVTGIDTSVDALLAARRAAPRARFLALDQRCAGALRWSFDAVLVLWNSFGFGTRADDSGTLRGLQRVVRPGGRLLLDLYQPDWLRAHEQFGADDGRAIVDRSVHSGRCFHTIRYRDGTVDNIQFNIYEPDEIRAMVKAAGFRPGRPLAWWRPDLEPGPAFARYQLVCTRA